MIQRFAAVAFALALTPAALYAQDPEFTVTVASADVHKGPSVVTPVIGHVARGAALPISRNLGSWVKISWPAAPDGVGYVHVTMGRLAASSTLATPGPAPTPAPRTAADPGSAAPRAPSPARSTREQIVVSDESTGAPISHRFGVGARVATARSFGATARVWHKDRVGIQFSFTRETLTSDLAAGRVTAMQVEPAVVVALFDHVSDYFWIRPYVGSGVSVQRQRLNASSAEGPALTADTGIGFRLFGGSELTFAGAQQFGLSVEFGYRRVPTPFPGFEPDKMSTSIAGHWYIR